MSNGWIKLHRKILDCFIWQDKPYDKARAWIDLLLIAMHHDKKMLIDDEVVMIQRGSFMTSIVKLADRWGWSRNKVVRYLDMLESEHMLNTKRTPKGTLITIVKYDDYQLSDMSCESTNESTYGATNETPNESTDGATNESADESQNKNIKNNKNVKNEKKERKGQAVYYPNDELLNNAFKEFLTMRNKIKKPLATKQALTRMMNKIEKLSCGDNDLAIKILNQSTDHCWQDVYELKIDGISNGHKAKESVKDINADRQSQLDYLLQSIREEEENDGS